MLKGNVEKVVNTRHYLFCDKEREEEEGMVRFDYPPTIVNGFIKLWKEQYSINAICDYYNLKEIEGYLLAMSLNYSGLIEDRKYGYMGKEVVK